MDKFVFEGWGGNFLIQGDFALFLSGVIFLALIICAYQLITKKGLNLPFLRKLATKSVHFSNGDHKKLYNKMDKLEKKVEDLSKEQATFKAKVSTEINWIKNSLDRIYNRLDRRLSSKRK